MTKLVRWGIIGAGGISARFVNDVLFLARHPQGPNKLQHVLRAVGCSQIAKGDAFIRDNLSEDDIAAHGTRSCTYDEVLDDPDVDVLYIGLLHPFHKDIAIKGLNRGKHILCEKPVAMNSAELKAILDAARANGRFFMEAMWVRFFPGFVELQHKIHEEKVLGRVRRVIANHSMDALTDEVGASHRLVNKELGGGAVLDIGVYALTFCRLFLDPRSDPIKDWNIQSSQQLQSFTGNKQDEVDFMMTALIDNGAYGQHAVATSSFYNEVVGPSVVIEGELGKAAVYPLGDTPSPLRYEIILKDGSRYEKSFPFEGIFKGVEGFFYEAVETGEMIFQGKLESAVIPWQETINIMGLIDTIREQNDLVYPQDLHSA